jgi:hypothetical protein
VVFQRIFDLGGTLNLHKVRAILGGMAEFGAVLPKRATPEYVSFAAPIPINVSSLVAIENKLTDELDNPKSGDKLFNAEAPRCRGSQPHPNLKSRRINLGLS